MHSREEPKIEMANADGTEREVGDDVYGVCIQTIADPGELRTRGAQLPRPGLYQVAGSDVVGVFSQILCCMLVCCYVCLTPSPSPSDLSLSYELCWADAGSPVTGVSPRIGRMKKVKVWLSAQGRLHYFFEMSR